MSSFAIGLSMFGLMLVLMAVRVPIAIAMFVPGALGYLGLSGWLPLLAHLKGAVYGRVSVYDLSVIPLFMLMGGLAVQGGLAKALFDFANALLGRFRGGMAMAGVLACAAFGSISGSTVATTATIAQVAYPQMRRIGYSGRLATAALATGGTMGVLLPPSVTLMVYAILTEQNITKMFLAAYVPALLAAIGYLLAIAVVVRLQPQHAPSAQAARAAEIWASARRVWPIVVIFVVVFGGIYGGLFTATEGAAIGVVLTCCITLARRELDRSKFVAAIRTTAQTSGMIFMIFIGADMLNAALALSQLPTQLSDLVGHLQMPPLLVMGGIMLGLGRALGETMAVTFVIGNMNQLDSLSLFEAANSITSALANEFAEANEGLHQASLIYLGLVLFFITFVVLSFSRILLSRLKRNEGAAS